MKSKSDKNWVPPTSIVNYDIDFNHHFQKLLQDTQSIHDHDFNSSELPAYNYIDTSSQPVTIFENGIAQKTLDIKKYIKDNLKFGQHLKIFVIDSILIYFGRYITTTDEKSLLLFNEDGNKIETIRIKSILELHVMENDIDLTRIKIAI